MSWRLILGLVLLVAAYFLDARSHRWILSSALVAHHVRRSLLFLNWSQQNRTERVQ